jgi:iron(III) transport system ATP-binding protein
MPSASIIELEGIEHAYGSERVLRDLSLSVGPGEILGILGVSGSGKSTLLRIIAGFVQPTKGRVIIGEREVFSEGRERIPPEQRGLGMMFQDYALFPYLTVRENIGYGIHKSPNREERVQSLLELVGLNELSNRRPTTLSGGQQQRVALVRALAPQPRALLLDEPFANLDGPMRHEVGSEIRRILKAQGTSALLVTHDRREALALSDRVAVMGTQPDGTGSTVVQLGTPAEVYQRPSSREVAELTGPSCFLEGMAQGEFAESSLGRIPLVDPQIGSVILVIRPDSMRFQPVAEGSYQVLDQQFQGPGTQVRVAGPAGELWCQASAMGLSSGVRGEIEVVDPCAALPS